MKRRNGFVSNSSSSSFILLVPTSRKTNYEQVKANLIEAIKDQHPYVADNIEESYYYTSAMAFLEKHKTKLGKGFDIDIVMQDDIRDDPYSFISNLFDDDFYEYLE